MERIIAVYIHYLSGGLTPHKLPTCCLHCISDVVVCKKLDLNGVYKLVYGLQAIAFCALPLIQKKSSMSFDIPDVSGARAFLFRE